jgi:trehalose 6-phosphate phosphatase
VSLDDVRVRLGQAAILLDFDGTLAPIVPEPEDARPWPGIGDALQELADRAGMVAIISGRPEAFIRRVLDVPKVEVVGLYGLEGAPTLAPEIVETVSRLAAAEVGARIEDKRVSVTVHVRGATDPEASMRRLRPAIEELAARNSLTAFEGKRVIELAPPGSRKGAVVTQLATRAEPAAAIYAGDDLEDREAFEALDPLGIPACRIAVLGAETPEELRRAADVLVEGPPGLLDLLRTL